MSAVGIIGTGAMGLGVTRALLAKGFPVYVRDIVPERQAAAVALGARGCDSPRQVASRCSTIITLVVDAPQTEAVLFGPDGVTFEKGAGEAVMMCSTISPDDAESFATRLAVVGMPMIDAPLSGGPKRAHAGTLSMMAAGPDPTFLHCARVIDAMAAHCFRISARPGDGSRMKIVNNMLAAANLAAGCEAMAVATMLGMDLRQVRDVVSASSGGSWILGDRMGRMLEGDDAVHAAARVLAKDIGLFDDMARSQGLATPMAACARMILQDTVDRGYGEQDDAVVLKRYLDTFGVMTAPSGGEPG